MSVAAVRHLHLLTFDLWQTELNQKWWVELAKGGIANSNPLNLK